MAEDEKDEAALGAHVCSLFCTCSTTLTRREIALLDDLGLF